MKRLVLILWQMPQAILGLFVFLFVKKIDVDIDEHYIFVWTTKNWGLSLFPFIFANRKAPDNTLLHEKGHACQSAYFGPFYLFVIGLPSIIRAILWTIQKRDPEGYYRGFPENWADKLGGVKR